MVLKRGIWIQNIKKTLFLKRSILKAADRCFLASLQHLIFGHSLAFPGLQPHNSNLFLCHHVAISLWISVFTQPSSFIMQLPYFQIRSHSEVPRVRSSTWLLENMIQSVTRAQPENLFTSTIFNNAKKKKMQWIRNQFKKRQPPVIMSLCLTILRTMKLPAPEIDSPWHMPKSAHL